MSFTYVVLILQHKQALPIEDNLFLSQNKNRYYHDGDNHESGNYGRVII